MNKLLPRYLDFSASNTAANQARQTGENAINSFDPTATASTQRGNLGAGGLGGLLGSETQAFGNQYRQAIAANPDVTSLYKAANEQFNVPYLAQNAANLQNRVTNTIPAEFQAARGFDIGAPQVENAAAARTAYLAPQAQAAQNLAQTAQGLAGQQVQAGITQNQMNLLPIQAQQQMELQRQAAQATGWNQASQQELEGLIQKMNAGITLSGQEMARANALAQAEASYQSAVVNATASQNVARIGQQFQTVPAGSTLFNTLAGTFQRAR